MNKKWTDWKDEELVDEAQAGLRGQGSTVEMTRRLKDAIERLNGSTAKLNYILIMLTVILVGLTVVLVIVGVS